jgi:thioredoxin-related protein
MTSSTKETCTMRKISSLILFLCIALMVLPAQIAAKKQTGANINWSTYDEAQKAGNDSRKFFIYFYTDQCGYCKLLEANTFTDKNVVDYINSNYAPVRVNAGKEINVASRFGIQGVPDLRFLSSEGESIARWPGYIESEPLLAMLRYIHTDSYKEMSFSDFVKRQKRD